MSDRLSALPAELRNRIYELALIQPERITVSVETKHQSALAQVSKRLRQECRSINYTHNTFTFQVMDNDTSLLVAWLTAVGGATVRVIESIHVDCYGVTSLARGKDRDWTQLADWFAKIWNYVRSQGPPFEYKIDVGIEHHPKVKRLLDTLSLAPMQADW